MLIRAMALMARVAIMLGIWCSDQTRACSESQSRRGYNPGQMNSRATYGRISHVYRVVWYDRLTALSVLVIVAAGVIVMSQTAHNGEGRSSMWASGFVGLLAIGACVQTLGRFYNRITLYESAIEYRTVWSTDWLRFDEIRGRREFDSYRGRRGTVHYLRIVPSDKDRLVFDFEDIYNFDDAFYSWFRSLPDLEQATKATNVAQV
jgi:hypothetical protein